MAMRIAVRNGRRTNFFMIDNSFMDHYAAKVGGSGLAVYCVLQRCADSQTRLTWISACKIAEILEIDRSTVYRKLKELEDLRLISSMRKRERTIYNVLDVPAPRPQAATTPLFDGIGADASETPVWPPEVRMDSTNASDSHSCDDGVVPTRPFFSPVQRPIAPVQRTGRTGETCNKEEQDSLNKTQEQDFFNKSSEKKNNAIHETAQRVIAILGLRDDSLDAAIAAVEMKVDQTKLSMDGVVQEIVTAANLAERRRVDKKVFLNDFLADALSHEVLGDLGLPDTHSMAGTVKAALKAESSYSDMALRSAASLITASAMEDSARAVVIDRFYFEHAKWRSNGRVSRAEQRKLGNLEVNARVKQRLREKFGAAGVDQR